MGRPRLHLLIVVTLINLVVALWYLLRYQLSEQQDAGWYLPSATITCNLHAAPCSAAIGNTGRVSLVIPVEESITQLVILPVEVMLEDIEADRVRVSLDRADMGMDWRIRIVLETPRERMQAGLRL